MRNVFLLLFIVLSYGNTYAQNQLSTKSSKAIKFYREAMANYNLMYYDEAIKNLKLAIETDKKFIDAYILIGEVNIDNGNEKDAIRYFIESIKINPDFFPLVYSNLAYLEFNNGLYEDALIHIQKFLSYPKKSDNSKKSAETLLKSCEFAINAVKNPVPFNPVNLGPNINSKNDEYWPSLSADEQTLVFTRLMPINSNNPDAFRNRQEDFYYSTFKDGQWTPSQPVGPPINTPGNEGAQSISADGKFMVFTGCDRRDGYGSCDLYFSRKEGDKWSVPQNMGRPVNTSAKETQPSLSADGKTLYFSSNRPNGKGGLDIWKSTLKDNGTWSEPENLGDSINTSFDEQSPFIHPDNKTLYFSSNGWPGLGRFDLFVSHKKDDDTWTTPKNLGYPINTHFNEEGLIVNARGNKAYYSSTRDGEGGRDLFSFDLYNEVRPDPVSYMKGKVFDAETYFPLKAHFELTDLASNTVVTDAWSDAVDGTFLICIPSGKDYALNVNKNGYLFYSDHFTMTTGDFTKPFLKDVPLQVIKVGEKVIMRNIFFDYDSYVLKPESKSELAKLLVFLTDNPKLTIEISGHTDNKGSAEYNKKLSENRALAVVTFLINNSIDSKRITSSGYGDTQPIADNDTDEGRALNRRTEFKVISR
jgi:outer membrane protein OmpA-like peptidoglycan-associated protein